MSGRGEVVAVCVSARKGIQKAAVTAATLVEGHGIEGDAHAGPWHRQVSLLAEEDIDLMRAKGIELDHGDFGENIVTRGIDLLSVAIGERLRLGDEAIVEVTQHGKECHDHCAIYEQAGECIMPKRGIFARVLHGGPLEAGDVVEPT